MSLPISLSNLIYIATVNEISIYLPLRFLELNDTLISLTPNMILCLCTISPVLLYHCWP
jgi:hypothetical protein